MIPNGIPDLQKEMKNNGEVTLLDVAHTKIKELFRTEITNNQVNKTST